LAVRKLNRLKGYDYSRNGVYFVTICTNKHHEIFGEIVGAGLVPTVVTPIVQLSENGKIAENEIMKIEQHYDCVFIDCFVIMPNHVHLIIIISNDSGRATGRASPSPTLGNVIGGYKSGVSRLCGFPVWQRSYHDHIIRDIDEHFKIAEYIKNNPATWLRDCFHADSAKS